MIVVHSFIEHPRDVFAQHAPDPTYDPRGYLQRCFSAMRQLATSPNQLTFREHLVGRTNSGSDNHAIGISKALAEVNSGPTYDDIHVICDSDTVVVRRGWDDLVKAALKNGGCIGTTFADIGQFGAGDDLCQMFKGHPGFTWIALSPWHPWHLLETATDVANPMKIETAEQSRTFGLPVGHSLLKDVGWQLPAFTHGIPVKRWDRKAGDDRLALKGLSEFHEEFWDADGPIVCHQRGSRKIPYNTGQSKDFYDAVDRFMLTVAVDPITA